MSANPNGFSCHARRVVVLACAAMLPLAHAAVRHTQPRAAAKHATGSRAAAPAQAAHSRGSSRAARTATKPVHAEGRLQASSGRNRSGGHAKATSQAPSHDAAAPETLAHWMQRHPEPSLAKQQSPAARPDTQADRATADRVHAWYSAQGSRAELQARQAQADATADAASASGQSAPQPKTGSQLAGAAMPAATSAPKPDLSLTPHKATVEDFQKAQQRQTETLRRAAVVNQARTSTADDAIAIPAESHIPSTAPTERVTAPFVHGSFSTPEVLAASGAPAPIPAPRQPGLPSTAAKLSAQTRPADPALKPVDPNVMDGMAAETFATDDAPPAAAKAAVILAAKTARPDPVTKTPVLQASEADEDASVAASRVNPYVPVGSLQMLAPMRGTHEILVHQNQMALADGLERIENDSQLLEMRRRRLLLALPENGSVAVDERLPLNRRFARPWSVKFLNDLGRAHAARFGTPLVVTSAARTVAFQRHLVLVNGNAAPPTGNVASPHLYGQALDIAKHGMSVTEIAWMRAYLTPVEADGKIDVEEEFQQSCFHISVYRRYLGAAGKKSAPPEEQAPSRVMQQVRATPPPQRHRRLPTAILATGLR